ncbi:hypothetical protein FOL47_003271 [Perkinsus chesapeaki]|uniref:Uncharacterized protein n=1 Tax=Perkinsus chesapeaki TaxID=330153 RepID=A0A7J6N2S7_PERCH|nr:hypothetical protein FOL47_003271 [Perkinsus chesapeaki]
MVLRSKRRSASKKGASTIVTLKAPEGLSAETLDLEESNACGLLRGAIPLTDVSSSKADQPEVDSVEEAESQDSSENTSKSGPKFFWMDPSAQATLLELKAKGEQKAARMRTARAQPYVVKGFRVVSKTTPLTPEASRATTSSKWLEEELYGNRARKRSWKVLNDRNLTDARTSSGRRSLFFCCFRGAPALQDDPDIVHYREECVLEHASSDHLMTEQASGGLLTGFADSKREVECEVDDSQNSDCSSSRRSQQDKAPRLPEKVDVAVGRDATEGCYAGKSKQKRYKRSSSDPRPGRAHSNKGHSERGVGVDASVQQDQEEGGNLEQTDADAPTSQPLPPSEPDCTLDLEGMSDGLSPSPKLKSGSPRSRSGRPNLPRLSLSTSRGNSPQVTAFIGTEKAKQRYVIQSAATSPSRPASATGHATPGPSPVHSPPTVAEQTGGGPVKPVRRSSMGLSSLVPRIPLGDDLPSPRTDGALLRARNSAPPLTERTHDRRGKLHYAAVAAENMECTFRPQICAKSRKLAANRKTELELYQPPSPIVVKKDEKKPNTIPKTHNFLPPRRVQYDETAEPRIATTRVSVAQLRAALASSVRKRMKSIDLTPGNTDEK